MAYTGPGDILSGAIAFYGLRGYNAAVSTPGTTKAIQLLRASDSTTQDINILASGDLDVATAATFISGTTALINKFYDQIGGNASLDAASQINLFTLNFIGSLPTVQTLNDNWRVNVGTFPATAVPITIASCVERTGPTSNFGIIATSNGGAGYIGVRFKNAAGLINATGDGGTTYPLEVAAANGALRSLVWVNNGASSALNIDGTDQTGAAGGTNGITANNFKVCQDDFGTGAMVGYFQEVTVYNVAATLTQRNNLVTNMQAYWTSGAVPQRTKTGVGLSLGRAATGLGAARWFADKLDQNAPLRRRDIAKPWMWGPQ